MKEKTNINKNNILKVECKYCCDGDDMICVSYPDYYIPIDTWAKPVEIIFTCAGIFHIVLTVGAVATTGNPILAGLATLLTCGYFGIAVMSHCLQNSQNKKVDYEIEKFADSVSCNNSEEISKWKTEFKKNHSLLLHKKTLKMSKKQDFEQEK